MEYRTRIIDAELDELAALPAIALEGARGVGKTTTAARRARTKVSLADPARCRIVAADPRLALEGEGPVLLSEWQRVPALWDAVRRAVDDGDPRGPFLLTSSAGPAPDATVHSGAGRITSLRVRPMTLPERLDLETTVSLSELLAGAGPQVSGRSDLDLAGYAAEIVASGLPSIRRLAPSRRRSALRRYIDTTIDHDLEQELGLRVRRRRAFHRWLTVYAAATASAESYERIRRAAAGDGERAPSKETAIAWREALEHLFICDPLPGWAPLGASIPRLTQSPKHHLVDPALSASILGLDEGALLCGRSLNGLILRRESPLEALFESLAALTVRVFAQAAEARTYHLRTQNGKRSISLIVESPDGGVVALQVRLTAAASDEDVRDLLWLRRELGERLREAVVLTSGSFAYRRPDGIAVVPLALLGP